LFGLGSTALAPRENLGGGSELNADHVLVGNILEALDSGAEAARSGEIARYMNKLPVKLTVDG